MTKVDITPGADAPTELRTGYHKLLLTLKEKNETFVFFPVIPITTNSALVDPEEILTRMSALMIHFTETSRIKENTWFVWETTRLGCDRYFEMTMNHTEYDLRADNIILMKKHIQLPFTETICYLQFVKNTIDTDSAQKLIQGYLRKFNPVEKNH